MAALALALTAALAPTMPVSAVAASAPAGRAPQVAKQTPSVVTPLASARGREELAAAEGQYAALLDAGADALAEQADNLSAARAQVREGAAQAGDAVGSRGLNSTTGSASGGNVTQGKPGSGDYSATPLSESSVWESGGASGSFSWTYPFRTPIPSAGPTPQVKILYNSGSVDGRTFTSNNQPSVLGEGFELSNSYIERSYGSCHDDGHANKYDLCWRGEQLTLVLNGAGYELVRAGNDDTFRFKQDDGSTLIRQTGTVNGDNNGEFWQLTTPDGTEWTFGRNRLPGWTQGSPITNSTWAVPVVTDDANDPAQAQVCKDGNYAPATSWCQQAWRWNLDLVTDVHSNSASYWYAVEENHYARNGNESNPTRYDRGGYLTRIDYGLRRSGLYEGGAVAAAPYRVRLNYTERCLANDCENLIETTKARWPDVPFDAICRENQTCADDVSPSFFTRKRLTQVTTSLAAPTGYRDVDQWDIEHAWVDPGDVGDTSDQILWPSQIKQTGKASTPEIRNRPVRLLPSLDAALGNRVDRTNDGIAPLIRPRLSQIISETGAITTVQYSSPECTSNNLPAPSVNGRRCYPVWWSPSGGEPQQDWFHKYVVEAVSETDTTTGETVVTDYEYVGNPAWHYSEDPFTANVHRTWSQWRGYERVNVLVGHTDSAVRSLTSTVYMRGMHGDRNAAGDARQVYVNGINAEPLLDQDALAGSVREVATYDGRNRDGSNRAAITDTIYTPAVIASRAEQTYPGAQIDGKDAGPVTVTSNIVRVRKTQQRTRVTSGTTPFWRSHVVEVQLEDYDDLGYPLFTNEYTQADDATTGSGDKSCTRTWYSHNRGAGLLGLVARAQKLAVGCANFANAESELPTNSASSGPVISDVAIKYDEAASWTGQNPTRGLRTWIGRAERYSGGSPTFQTDETASYDALGRTRTSADASGAATTTSYVPTGAGVPVSRTDTNAKGHQTTSILEPAFGVDTSVTDPNGRVTEKTYDALGRLTAVWAPNVSRASGAPATYKYAYHAGGGPGSSGGVDHSWIATSTPSGGSSGYNTTYEIFDALLRPRQTQVPSPAGGRVLTDIQYNDRGLADRSFANVWDDKNAPNGTRQIVAEGGFIQNDTRYDGANRPVTETTTWGEAEQDSSGSTNRSRSVSITYTGDSSATTAAAGGLGERVITDPLGREIERRVYPNASPSGTAYVSTKLAYNPQGRLQSVTAVDGSQWKYAYDIFGRNVTTTDPDRGRTSTTFDTLDRVQTTVDAENRTLNYSYDVLGRKTGLYLGAATPTNQISEWTYDTVPGGLGLPASSTRYTDGKVTGQPAYVKAVTAYDPLSRPIRTTLSLPDTDPLVSGPPAGNAARVPAVLEFRSTYNRDGTIKSSTEPAVPGLQSEVVSVGYDATGLGLPTTLSGATGIVQNTAYTQFAELAMLTLGLSPANSNRVWINYAYDGLRRLSRFDTTENNASTHLLDLTYTYNQSDQITAITDSAANDADFQCFSYGTYQRLNHAWTPKTKDCATDKRVKANIGGKAPYWHSFTYNLNGTRASSTVRPITSTGTAAVTNYTYGGTCANGGVTVTAGPHALTKTVTGTDTDAYCVNKTGATTKSVAPNDATRTTTWNAEGKLDTLTQGTTNYSHIYDADGELLIKRPTGNAAGTTTLYLGATEVQVTKSGATTPTYTAAARRTYLHAGQRVAVRRGSPGSSSKLFYVASDHHNTATAQWDAEATYATRAKRYSTPFGAARGTAPSTWVDDKRFLGKAHDDVTGLTHVSAREYDSAIGRFLSVDPLLDLTDPQSVNGYTYSNSNPLNLADPSGLRPDPVANIRPTGSSASQSASGSTGTASNGATAYYHEITTVYTPHDSDSDSGLDVRGFLGEQGVKLSAGVIGSGADLADFVYNAVDRHDVLPDSDLEGSWRDKVEDEGLFSAAHYWTGFWGTLAIPGAGWAGGALRAPRILAGAGRAASRVGSLLGRSFERVQRRGNSILRRAVDDVPVGVDDVFAGLPKGKNRNVRTVGSDAELDNIYSILSRGGSPLEVPNYKGTWILRSDGIRIGLRETSKSGERTIDIRHPEGTIRKIHIE